ncbi:MULTISPECIES: hypothetical protein [Moorena]|nr:MULTISPECIES: hypothetical protein [Moorena]NEO81335.1 hypothetical protein [Moorena sp. SIO4G3]
MAIPTDDLSNLEKLAGIVVNLIEAELNQGASQDVYLYGESKGSLSGA